MSQSKLLPDFECTKFCNSRQHGSVLTSAITKRAVSDAALASFCRYNCYNFMQIIDKEGRSLLHMVASRGRRLLLEWLLRLYSQSQWGSNIIDYKDLESGYTAFHRSIFYGQIHAAIILMKSGVNVSIVDNEDMTAIDLALIDRHPRFEISKYMPCEVYTWGANSNYTLGTSSQRQVNFPELLTNFSKQRIYIKQVCLSKFHSAFVSTAGDVWTCGHGEGGRLGIATSETRVLPSQISLQEPCLQIAVGRDHTIFLLQSGTMLSCGLNNYFQLGQVPPPKSSLSPCSIKLKLSAVRGVCAARYHSVAYNANVLYTWGLNGGQLGHPKEKTKTILVPLKVTGINNNRGEFSIMEVAVSDGATVLSSSKGDIFLLHQYKLRKIAHRIHNLKTIKVIGGEIDGGDRLTEEQKKIRILILDTVGNAYIWDDSTNHFTRCIFNINRPMFIMQIALTRETVLFSTKHGEAYQGNITSKKITLHKRSEDETSKTHYNQFVTFNKDECMLIKLKRLPNIHRAVDICCDIKGNNFAVLQVAPNANILDIPQITSSQLSEDMKLLLDEATEDDLLHDIIFKVKNNIFPAHRYVISYASEYFKELCNEKENTDVITIEIENVHPIIFKQILLYMYTGTCDLMTLGPCNIKTNIKTDDNKNEIEIYEDSDISNLSAYEVYAKKEKSQKAVDKINKNKDIDIISDPVRLLQSGAKKLQITALYKILSVYCWQNGNIILRDDKLLTNIKFKFDRSKLKYMFDANIKCSDGIIIKAHKCILAARLEYFNGMFAHSWTENSRTSTITLPINHKMLTPIINYLYTDECPELEECEDFEFLGNMLVICDQFFIARMREMCEVALSNLLTLRNITDILQVADTYNCPQLKNCCMEYISLNLSHLLETKTLEVLTPGLLEDLSKYYISFNPTMSKRNITPFFDSPSDEIITSIANTFPINIKEDSNEDELLDEIQKSSNTTSEKKRKIRVKKNSVSESDKIRKRNESTSSVNSLDISYENEDTQIYFNEITDINYKNIETDQNAWTKVQSAHQKQQKIIQARLKAVTAIRENNKLLESGSENFTKLIKTDSRIINNEASHSPIQSPTQKPHFGSPYKTSVSLKHNEDNSLENICSNLKTSLNITVVNTKLSQKQRKKLASENKDNSLLAEQLNKINTKSPADFNETQELPSARNPWQKIEALSAQSPNSKVDFSEILEDQRKQKENLTRMMTKSLALTQLEDKAIEELTKFYNSRNEEERISVKRIPCAQIAPPQWIHKSFKNDKLKDFY